MEIFRNQKKRGGLFPLIFSSGFVYYKAPPQWTSPSPQNNQAYDEPSLTHHFGNVLDPEGFARHKERREHVLDIHMPENIFYTYLCREHCFTHM